MTSQLEPNISLTAGKWWLPSLGEMFMIYANMTKINYALSLITGATQLVEDWYWTSTENSGTSAWNPVPLTADEENAAILAGNKRKPKPLNW